MKTGKLKQEQSLKYCVVEYEELDGLVYVSAVPLAWVFVDPVDGTSSMHWPREKLAIARKQMLSPSKDWAIVANIKVLGKYVTFKEALYKERKSVKSGTESSDSAASSFVYEKQKRTLKKKYKDDSVSPPPTLLEESSDGEHVDFEEGEETQIFTNLSEPQKFSEHKSSHITPPHHSEPTVLEGTVNPQGAVVLDESMANLTLNNFSLLNSGPSNQVLYDKLEAIECKIEIILERFIELEKTKGFPAIPPLDEENVTLFKQFPLTDISELQELELTLNDENQKQLYNKLKLVGGKDLKKTISRLLEKVFTNYLGQFCSWTGRKGNYKLSNMKLFQVIHDAVKFSHPMVTDEDFERGVQAWFQHAKTRFEREK